jgi:hypothetical protein
MGSSKINWPVDLRPENSPVYTYNELVIPAEPRLVWAWLVRAEWWPRWYPHWKAVKILSPPGPDLAAGTVFVATAPILKIFSVKIKTSVQDFAPGERLAWRGKAFGTHGYHAWIIESQGSGCKVITEETQRGLLVSLTRSATRREILDRHQTWLEGLAKMSQSGLPA